RRPPSRYPGDAAEDCDGYRDDAHDESEDGERAGHDKGRGERETALRWAGGASLEPGPREPAEGADGDEAAGERRRVSELTLQEMREVDVGRRGRGSQQAFHRDEPWRAGASAQGSRRH